MRVMLLQGPPSPFARELGAELVARGHHVTRVLLSFGDWLFGRGDGAILWRGRFADWEGWVEARMRAEGITHLVYYADRQPHHVIAQRVARRLGLSCVSYENGYLRPDWIVVEEGGQGAFSHFPADLALVKRLAADLPTPDMRRRYGHGFAHEAVAEMACHLGNWFFAPLFPGFRADRAVNPVLEYLSYLPRHLQAWRGARAAERVVADLFGAGRRFHLLALQMAGDYQIRANSPWRDLRAFVAEVIRSYARHGPAEGVLVVKRHPMDNGWINWPRVVARLAREAGIAERVVFLDGGDLGRLLRHAEGCVLVNSTVGLHALQAGCPVLCRGVAVYDMAGLTHQGGLDVFWTAPERPDPEGVAALVRLMAAAIHVRGDFLAVEGRRVAVAAVAARLEAGLARPFGAFLPFPPRLEQARAAGLPLDPWPPNRAGGMALDVAEPSNPRAMLTDM